MIPAWVLPVVLLVVIIVASTWATIWLLGQEPDDERDPRLIDPDADLLDRYEKELPRGTRRQAKRWEADR